MSLVEQLGNVSSEVARSFAAARAGDIDCRDRAVVRALDLFDATLEGLYADVAYRAKGVQLARNEFLRVARADVLGEAEAAALER